MSLKKRLHQKIDNVMEHSLIVNRQIHYGRPTLDLSHPCENYSIRTGSRARLRVLSKRLIPDFFISEASQEFKEEFKKCAYLSQL